MPVASPATAPATRPLPALRLLPAPCSEPPYDDELPEGARLRLVTTGRAAPLLLRAAPAVPVRPVVVPGAEAAPGPRLAPPGDDDEPVRTPLEDLPPVRPFARALVQRLLEVLAGLRPLAQLQRDTSLELFDLLEQRLSGRARPAGVRPSPRDVRSVHVQSREDGVAEVCAVVRLGRRTTAVAFRLEGRAGSWRCTALAGLDAP